MTKEPIMIDCEYCIVLGNENKCKALQIETHTCLGITAKNKCPIYKLKTKAFDWESAAMRSKRELEQYKKSKQASYETMQREWNEAKNEVKELKKLLKTRIEDLCDSCGASSMMPMPCKVYEQALQEIKEICNSVWGNGLDEEVDKFHTILQKCEVIDE